MRGIDGGGLQVPLTGQQVIVEECRMFIARLRLRASSLHPDEAAEVDDLADRLSPLAGS